MESFLLGPCYCILYPVSNVCSEKVSSQATRLGTLAGRVETCLRLSVASTSNSMEYLPKRFTPAEPSEHDYEHIKRYIYYSKFVSAEQGFGRLDAGSRAGFTSSRPPPP